jgi:hypothetical protein
MMKFGEKPAVSKPRRAGEQSECRLELTGVARAVLGAAFRELSGRRAGKSRLPAVSGPRPNYKPCGPKPYSRCA